MSFKDNDKDRELLVHQTQPEACGLVDFRKSTDGIRVSDWLKIKQRKSKIDEQQYWMHIFEVLFDSRPQSGDPCKQITPYIDCSFKLISQRSRGLFSTCTALIPGELYPRHH
jgi:hypothetical protein